MALIFNFEQFEVSFFGFEVSASAFRFQPITYNSKI